MYILKDNTAVRRDIVTGMGLSGKTENVLGGKATDKVLSSPELVYDGGRVRVNYAD